MDVTRTNKRDGTEVSERSKSMIYIIIKVIKKFGNS